MRSFLTGKTSTAALTAGGVDTIIGALRGPLSVAQPLCLNARYRGESGYGSDPCGPRPDREAVAFGLVEGGRYRYSDGTELKSNDFHILAGPGLRFNHDGGRTTQKRIRGRLGRQPVRLDLQLLRGSRRGGLRHPRRRARLPGPLGRLLWTTVEGDRFRNSAGEVYDVDDLDSLRSRVGAAYRHQFSPKVTGLIGAEWEYEFDSQADGRMDGQHIDEFSLKGSSALIRAGFDYQATDSFSLSLSAHGVTGQRKGAGGSLSLNYSF